MEGVTTNIEGVPTIEVFGIGSQFELCDRRGVDDLCTYMISLLTSGFYETHFRYAL